MDTASLQAAICPVFRSPALDGDMAEMIASPRFWNDIGYFLQLFSGHKGSWCRMDATMHGTPVFFSLGVLNHAFP